MNNILTIIGYAMIFMCVLVVLMAARNYVKYQNKDDDNDDWDESRIDTIGQNGNDGLHYNKGNENEN